MKKRIVCLILLLGTLVLSLASCFRMPEPLPSDFVEGDEIVVDNDILFVYDSDQKIEDFYTASNGEKIYYSIWTFAEHCREENKTYKYFTERFGNKAVHHYQSETNETYYTIFSFDNNTLLYLYLEPCENGDFRFLGAFLLDARGDHTLKDEVLAQDYPSVIMDGKMPDDCYLDYYTREEIAEKTENRWKLFLDECETAKLESYTQIMNRNYETMDSFYRCTHYVTFDITEGINGWHGLYSYDLLFNKDGTGTLWFRHFRHEDFFEYSTLQEAQVELTAEEVSALKAVIQNADFENVPTWNPEEFHGSDGETTYILGGNYSTNVHLISMWVPTPQYGIYQIRTAIEDLVRERIEVTSGRVYVDYE